MSKQNYPKIKQRILIGGFGVTFDPKKTTVLNTIVETAERYDEYYGKKPTHVSIPKTTTMEDRRMIASGLGLVIADDRYGLNMVLVGIPMRDTRDDSEKQGKGQSL